MRLRLTGVVLVLLGLVAAGTAVASATLWRPADHVRAEALASGKTTMLMTDPGVLELVADTVTVRAAAPQGTRIVAAVGREADVKAWVGTDAYTAVTGLADAATLATEPGHGVEPPVVSPSPPSASSPEPPTATSDPSQTPGTDDAAGDAAAGPADPALSDMWIVQAEGNGTAEFSWTHRPGRWVLLVATTGAEAGQPTLELTWPRAVVTPWLRPGSWLGGVLALAGIALLALAWNRQRSSTPAWVDVEDEPETLAPEVIGAPEVPAAPLTRRQLRELEAARGSARPGRPMPTVRRGGVVSTADSPSGTGPVEPTTVEPATPESATPEPATLEPTGASSPAAPAPGDPERGDAGERGADETQVIAVPDRAVEPQDEQPAYVPTFVPSRRGGVVPHIPATPAAPAARWTPTGAEGEAAAPSWPAMSPTPGPEPAAPEPAAPEPAAPEPAAPEPAQAQPAREVEPDRVARRSTAPVDRAPFGLRRPRRRTTEQASEQGSSASEGDALEPGAPSQPGAIQPGAIRPGAIRPGAVAHPVAPTEPGPAGEGPAAASVPTAAPRTDPGNASADAWRARWGFVEMPTPPAESTSETEEGQR